MISIRKKGAVYGIIALMLCVAVYLNWSYVKTPDDLAVADQTKSAETAASSTSTASNAADAVGGSKDTVSTSAQSSTAGTQQNTQAAAVSKEDYFSQSRLSRQKARDEAIGILKNQAEQKNVDDKTKQDTEKKISAMADNAVQEANVESLIKAKGYAEAVVFIGDDSVNVVVQPPKNGLQDADVAKIRDIVTSQVSVGADKIKIVAAA